MSVDADRVVALATSAHELWSLPVQILVALVLLYTQVPGDTAPVDVWPFLTARAFSICLPDCMLTSMDNPGVAYDGGVLSGGWHAV